MGGWVGGRGLGGLVVLGGVGGGVWAAGGRLEGCVPPSLEGVGA